MNLLSFTDHKIGSNRSGKRDGRNELFCFEFGRGKKKKDNDGKASQSSVATNDGRRRKSREPNSSSAAAATTITTGPTTVVSNSLSNGEKIPVALNETFVTATTSRSNQHQQQVKGEMPKFNGRKRKSNETKETAATSVKEYEKANKKRMRVTFDSSWRLETESKLALQEVPAENTATISSAPPEILQNGNDSAAAGEEVTTTTQSPIPPARKRSTRIKSKINNLEHLFLDDQESRLGPSNSRSRSSKPLNGVSEQKAAQRTGRGRKSRDALRKVNRSLNDTTRTAKGTHIDDKINAPATASKNRFFKTRTTGSLPAKTSRNPSGRQRKNDNAAINEAASTSSRARKNNKRQSGQSNDNESLQLIIDEKDEEYRKLKNSRVNNNSIIASREMMQNFGSFITPPESRNDYQQEFPGVIFSTRMKTPSLSLGYMKLDPFTLRPLECSRNFQLIFWVIRGTVTVRTCGGVYRKREGTTYMFGKSIVQGSSIIIPINTYYTFENRLSEEVLLGFSIIEMLTDAEAQT